MKFMAAKNHRNSKAHDALKTPAGGREICFDPTNPIATFGGNKWLRPN
jgi:hypothetical protein